MRYIIDEGIIEQIVFRNYTDHVDSGQVHCKNNEYTHKSTNEYMDE